MLTSSRDGSELQISSLQHDTFNGWKRPSELLATISLEADIPNCQVAMLGSKPMDLVQDITTDCSVVASLCTGISRDEHGFSQVY